jgi:MFS family permease
MKIKEVHTRRNFIMLICIIIQSVPFCIAQNLQSQMQIPVANSGFISEVEFSTLYISGTLPVLFNPYFLRIYDRFNIKLIYTLGLFIGGLSFLSFGYANSAFMFNICAFFNQIGTILFSGLSLPVLASYWYPGNGRGTALGIALAGGSIGNIFLQPVVVTLLESYGWRQTYMFLGIAIVVIGIPLALTMIRFPTEEETALMKNEAYIDPEKIKEYHPVETITNENAYFGRYDGLSDKETMKNIYYWIFNIGAMFLCFSYVGVSTQAIPVLIKKGFTENQAGFAGSFFGIACLIGNLVGGKTYDRHGSLIPLIFSSFATSLALILMAMNNENILLGYMIPILSGLTIYTITSGPAYMPPDIFGHRDETMKMAKTGMFFAIGGAFAAVLFTWLEQKMSLRSTCHYFLAIGIIGYSLAIYAIIIMKKRKYAKGQLNDGK